MVLDRQTYEEVARRAIGEGMVLLRNEGKVLPVKEGTSISVFGRMQNNYYKSGTGSGGMVNAGKVWSIMDALKLENVVLNEELIEMYEAFDKESPIDKGVGFGNEPWSQKEMPLTDEIVAKAADGSEVAIVIIGRTAGEAQDYVNKEGAYKLAELESDMLCKVRKAFKKVIVLMNVSAVLDMQELENIAPDAILYVWNGGEMGGLGTVDVLMGRVSPSGHLSDTIVKKIEDCAAFPYFGDLAANRYAEDIYVGYRYYETFAKDAVLYPFGFGLSYTEFSMKALPASVFGEKTSVQVEVTNTGDAAGKAVVQLYVSAPQGALGKPAIQLCGYKKTKTLRPGETEIVTIEVDEYTYSSYDDSGKSGARFAYVLEAGAYTFFIGQNVREIEAVGSYELAETKIIEQLTSQLAPIEEYQRMIPKKTENGFEVSWEDVPTGAGNDVEEAMNDQPAFIPYTGDKGYKLADVRDGKVSMDEFVAQMTDEDLTCIVRGEGMGSPKVTAGTAAAFGGVSKHLKEMGIPCGCCSDGPSGMRLDCGKKAFSLPGGTLLACTWNDELNKELYKCLGMEMTKNRVDVLLGPGINIHRYPLNGRNFEYFSEDPLLTGRMAMAQIGGLQAGGTTGTLKHFCANNQEANRYGIDSIVSERALREIYLKGFEMAVRAGANSVMTTYGAVNGSWTAGRHDLNTNLLRKEWGFKGIVMTDWWANIGDISDGGSKSDFARMVLAQNDFYAVCPDASINSAGDNTMESLQAGKLTRGHLTRCASNICEFLMHTNAMKRFLGEEIELELLNFNDEEDTIDPASVIYYDIEDGAVIEFPDDMNTDRGSSYVFGVNALKRGAYYMDVTGSSELGELSQINVAIFMQSIPGGNFGFHGTNGADMTIRRKIALSAKYGVIRLFFAGSGLKLKSIKFTYEKSLEELDFSSFDEYIYG